MVKIKILRNANTTKAPWLSPYIESITEAFKRVWFDIDGVSRAEYTFQACDGCLVCVNGEDCEEIEEPEKEAPTSQILMVEDGSVDVDDLAEWCADNSIKLIVYRQGANKPEFLK